MDPRPDRPAATPPPPCWAVVFTSQRSAEDPEGYARTAARMVELAAAQPGYLGHESARDEDGLGITVSYWASLEAIRAWRDHPEHLEAQHLGRERWYASWRLRVCRVEREGGSRVRGRPTSGDPSPRP